MTWEIIFAFVLLFAALGSFISEKIPTDLTALTVFAIIIGVSAVSESRFIPTIDEVVQVFANPASLTIAAMFILSAALNESGAIEKLSSSLDRMQGLGYHLILLIIILAVGTISAFINNTPVVVVFVPVVLSLSRKMGISASKLLIPLSYASIFGGCCTLVGTSTNILGSSILSNNGYPALSMFELSMVGLPLFAMGSVYLLLFAKVFIPRRDTLTSILSEEERKEYFTEAFVKEDSLIIGKSLGETGLLKKSGMRIIEIVRHGIAVEGQLSGIVLEAGDRVILSCRPSGFAAAQEVKGMDLLDTDGLGLEQIATDEGVIAEVVVSPTSSLISRNIREINFRQRFRAVTLAIHRHGRNVRDKLFSLRLQAGDTLLIMGTEDAIEGLRKSNDLLLLDRPVVSAKSSNKMLPFVIIIIGSVILLASLGIMPIVAASIIGVAAILLLGVIKPKEAYNSIQWDILILIFGMLALGCLMQKSGASDLIAESLAGVVTQYIPVEYQPYVMLAAIYFTTSFLTEVLSNNATIVLMAPIAISLAEAMGVDVRPFFVATCIAASASFATPIGYQTNTYIYSVGGYRFTDFFKIGLPLNLLYFTTCIFLVPVFWKF